MEKFMFQQTEEEKIYVHREQQRRIFFTAQNAVEENLTLAQSFQKQGRLYLFVDSDVRDVEEVKKIISWFRSVHDGEGLLLVKEDSWNMYNWSFLSLRGNTGRKMLGEGSLRLWIPEQGGREWRIFVEDESFVFQDEGGNDLRAKLEWATDTGQRLFGLRLVMTGRQAGCLTFQIPKPGSLRDMGVSLRYGVKKEADEDGAVPGPDAYDRIQIDLMEYAGESEKVGMNGCLDLCARLWQSRSCLSWQGEVGLDTAFRLLPTGQLHLTAEASEHREEAADGEEHADRDDQESMPPCLVWEKQRFRKEQAVEEYYLAPAGDFRVQENGRILLGLCGLEYLYVRKGDTLRFSPYHAGEAASGILVKTGGTTLPYLTALSGSGSVPCYYSQPLVRPLFRMGSGDTLPFCEVPFAAMDARTALPVFPAAGLDEKGVQTGMNLENQILCRQRIDLMTALTAQQAEKAQQAEPARLNGEAVRDGTELVQAVTEQGILVEYTQQSLSKDTFLRVEFTEDFVLYGVSGRLKAALMSGQCAIALSDAEEFDACCQGADMQLDVDGWGFAFPPETWEEHGTVIVLKYTREYSISEMASLPKQWSMATQGAVRRLQQTIDQLSGLYQEVKQFDRLRQVIADKEWCGVIVFHAVMAPGRMPVGLAFLSQGIEAEQMEAHHLILRARTLQAEGNAALSPSLTDGLIYYRSGVEFGERCPDYSFIVTKLEVLFEDSLTREFSCEMELLINRLFNTLTRPAGEADNSLIVIEGRYQEQDGVDSYYFALKENTRIGLLSSPVTEVNFTGAQLLIGGDAADSAVDFLLAGELYFEEKSEEEADGLDLYSYGQEGGGLCFTGLCVHMEHQVFEVRNSQMVFRADLSNAREGSFAEQIPMHPISLEVHDGDGITPASLGYMGISADGIKQAELTAKWSGILWEISLGGMGLLAENLAPRLLLLTAFSPDDSIFQSDALRRREDAPTKRYVGVRLAMGKDGGAGTGFSLSLQQFMQLSFRSLELKKGKTKDGKQGSCGILIRDFQLKALALSMPPGGNSIWIFGAPGAKKLAWFAEYTEEKG